MSLLLLALVMLAPGAKVKTQPPTFEKDATASLLVEAATVMAPEAEAGL